MQRPGIPEDDAEARREAVLKPGLAALARLLGHPLVIGPPGQTRRNHHARGYAANVSCPAFGTPAVILRAIAASDLAFDQALEMGDQVHISFREHGRRQVLEQHGRGYRELGAAPAPDAWLDRATRD